MRCRKISGFQLVLLQKLSSYPFSKKLNFCQVLQSTCLTNWSLLLLVSHVSDIVLETPKNDPLLFITFLLDFTCSKSISSRYGY